MQSGSVNYLAVVISAAAYWLLGALWYSPVLFARVWTRNIGKTEEQLKEGFSYLAFVWSYVWSFVAAYGVARLMIWCGGNSATDGFMVGLLIAVTFILAPMIINNLFERRPRSLLSINAAYHMLALIIAGVIIGAWR